MHADRGKRESRAVCSNSVFHESRAVYSNSVFHESRAMSSDSGIPDDPVAFAGGHGPVTEPGGTGEAARMRRTR